MHVYSDPSTTYTLKPLPRLPLGNRLTPSLVYLRLPLSNSDSEEKK